MSKKIIGICGLIGHGKDTSAGFLIEYGFQRISFAGVLKDACASIFSWDRDLLEGDNPESRVWRETVDSWWATRLGIPNFTPRYALQYIGTDVFRTHFHSDIWVAAAERQIEMTTSDVVISDCRFFNELDVIKRMNGITVSVWRDKQPEWWHHACNANAGNLEAQHVMNESNIHPSEYSWAGWEFDNEIYNTGSLEDLRENTLKLLG
jgi:hypothetical protein